MITRLDRGPLADWVRSVDRWLIVAFGLLMTFGLVMVLAASPAVAERLHASTFHFVNHQAIMLLPCAAVMVASSFLDARMVRRAALLLYFGAVACVLLALKFAPVVKGSQRWIFGIQPSEFVKPAFVVLAAWAIVEAGRSTAPNLAKILTVLILPATIIPLILQPDFGQTLLITAIWIALVFVGGLHMLWLFGVGGLAAFGGLLAYKFSPHVHDRVLRFLYPDSSGGMVDTFQVDTALQTILSGGWIGRGPGEGVVKRILPDAHTDFIFAVTGEEFGMLTCLALIAVFGGVVLRGLWLAAGNADPFARLAATGLALMFGLQSWINMAVNLKAIPAKGMTLPFISFGGSSMLALGAGMGFLLALTRRRPINELTPAPGRAAEAA